ncbi:hypothetical protein [Nocardia otitidiscaviarum]|uniref:hypothetical protein n=1 Tax=Nocardia otitidiscaviarum TaxID=1823 RepID=UPI001895CC68|nr:hypothetical protein [Nocardia otitidiscaviarum]MBF6183520.1 hypothetical protein [Nocardia otitidiscaviarum]
MPSDDLDQIEVQVIVDVLDTVETRLREQERCGWRLTVPRTRIYAIVLHAVIRSARTRPYPGTLDSADILDTIFDGIESSDLPTTGQPVEELISRHTVQIN